MLRQYTSRSNDLFDVMLLYLTQYIERLGTGTGEMIRLCREHGLPEPVWEITDGFKVTVCRKSTGKSTGKNLPKTQKAFVDAIRTRPGITMPELSEQLKLSISGVEKQIRKLRELEVIGRVGPAKGGHWEVLE